MPTLVVELGLGYGPFKTGVTWTDVSSYVQAVTVARGRSYELDDFQAGTCVVTFRNDTGLFDPMYGGGAYFGKLLPNVPIRVRATWNATTYPVFRGFVERWPPARYGGRYHSQTKVTCVDAFGLFANYRFPIADNGQGGGLKRLGTYSHKTGNFTSDHSFTGTDEAVRVYALASLTEYSSGAPASMHNLVFDVKYTNKDGTGNRLGQFRMSHRPPRTITTHTGRRRHHGHRATRHGHDGRHTRAERWNTEFDLHVQGNDTVHSIQDVKRKSGSFTGKDFTLYIWGERPILPRGTGDAQLQAALAYQGWTSSSLTHIKHAGRFTQIPDSPWDTDLLTVVRQIQDTELGQIYVDATGTVQFEDRDWRLNNWAGSKWHDGAVDGSGNYLGSGNLTYAECEPSYDNEHLATVWEITRMSMGSNDNPQTQIAQSGTGITTYGTVKGQRTTAVQTDQTAQKQAKYLLGFTQSPQYRINKLVIKPRRDPTNLWPSVLNLDISSGMTVQQFPPNSPTSSYLVQSDQWVEHVTHTITPDNWIVELETSPRMQISFPTS
jgi:hypothetical protein